MMNVAYKITGRSKIMEEISKEDFKYMHNLLQGEFYNICHECGGECEYTQLGIFLPGEVDYIAEKLNYKKEDFIRKYINVVEFKGKEIHLLKLGICPFLNVNKMCDLMEKGIKPITCRLYPLWIGLDNGQVTLKLDEDFCPYAWSIPIKFKRKAIKLFEFIKNKIPAYWLEFETQIDDYMFDYSKLNKFRKKIQISVEELLSCKI